MWRPRVLLLLLPALLAAAMVPFGGATSGREAATVIGSTTLAANNGTPDLFGKNVPVFQGAAAAGYVTSVPANGTLTSWSFRSAGVTKGSRFVLRVLRPVDTTTWRAIATSDAATVTSVTGTDALLGPFPAHLAVVAGDRIALQPIDDGYTPIEQGANGKDGVRYFTAPLPDGSSAALAPGSGANNGQIVPLQATLDMTVTALANTIPPQITGTVSVGQTLACSPGTWAQKPDSVAYAWLRDGTAIPGAAAATYPVSADDAGHALTCRTTATAGTASGSAASAAAQVPAVPVAAANTAPPRVIGVVKPGSTVTCDPGTWTGNPSLAYTWVWQRQARVQPFHLRQAGRLIGTTKGSYFHAAAPRTVTAIAVIATTRTLVVPDLPADGAKLGCTVTASGGAATAAKLTLSSQPFLVQTSPPSLERDKRGRFHPPSIARNVGSGSRNTCQPGLWGNYPTFTYAWYRLGALRHQIGPRPRTLLAKGQSIALTPVNEKMDIECVVTASNTAGSVALASNEYIVPAGAPHPLQQPFVEVKTESPNTAPGLVGPEGGTVIAEKIHLHCLGGHWDRGDLTFHTVWQGVDAKGNLAPNTAVAGERLDLDMSPGKPALAADVTCVVTATTSHGVSAIVRSGVFAVWNGCVWTRGPDAISVGTFASPYGLGLAAGTVATIATGGLAGLGLTAIFGDAGYGDFGLAYGAGDRIVYTVGPNCLDYQKWLEGQGYTVKQRDS